MKNQKQQIQYQKLPKEIIDSINDMNLLLFVGAGVSCSIGYPNWNELGNQLIDKCYENKLINYKERNILIKSDYKSVEKVSIAAALLDKLENNGGLNSVCTILREEAKTRTTLIPSLEY